MARSMSIPVPAIRIASVCDLADIEQCARSAYSKYVSRIGKEPAPMIADFRSQIERGWVYVIDVDSHMLGYVVFYRRADHLHLENVAVVPQAAGSGLGRRLIGFVEQAAQERGLNAVELYTNEKMHENLDMYPQLGDVEVSRRIESGFERVFYRKAL